MCGRIVQCSSIKTIVDTFDVSRTPTLPFAPHYNIPPSADILAVRLNQEGERELVRLKWGFVPHWAKDLSGPKPSNARAETVSEKPMFRDAFKRHRCLVPVDAFYEWQTSPQGKQPFCYRREDGQPFGIAAIWSHWHNDEITLETVSLVVTSANDLMAPIHDRVPVIIQPNMYGEWLTPGTLNKGTCEALLVPPSSEGFIAYAVTNAVNKPEHNAAELMLPV